MSGGELQIILPPRADESAPLDFGLISLTQAIEQIDHDRVAHGFLGGEHGYGARWENDTFLMRPYCWCEKAGECPWCTGCGIYQDTNACAACAARDARGHAPTCCLEQITAEEKAQGIHYTQDYRGSDFLERREAIVAAVIRKIGVRRPACTCGTDAAFKAAIKAGRGCDYQNGTGIFARFAPFVHDQKRAYYDPPNFWHKPSNFRVIWYKYIGRDMQTNRNSDTRELARIFAECAASLSE